MRVIFLDIDGVLNSQRYFEEALDATGPLSFGEEQLDPEAVGLLDGLVKSADADVIISSSWRHIWGYEEIAQFLKNRGMKNWKRVTGQTEVADGEHRGNEIQAWLDLERERQVVEPDRVSVQAYVILDDNDQFTSTQRPFFIHTNSMVGLTPADVARAAAILRSPG